MEEREEVRAGLVCGLSFAAVAAGLGRATSTVSREVARNGGRSRYRVVAAQARAERCRRRPKTPKLMVDAAMARTVERQLRAGYSPAAIAALLRRGDRGRISHETIYRALYSPRFVGLGLRAHDCLRSRRRRRRARGSVVPRGSSGPLRVSGVKMIDERPSAVLDRREPGHWEGDLMIGSLRRSAVVTLIERTSRLTLLADLPTDRSSRSLLAALSVAFERVPAHLRQTLTWDQGIEMSGWPMVERELGLEVFFCHAHSPWERGSNEHTNRQLRYWLPKGTDLSGHGQPRLDAIAAILNGQPRRIHGWQSAQEIYDHHAVALTA